MAQKLNSLYRVWRALNEASRGSRNETAVAAWAKVFGIDYANAAAKSAAVARKLALLHDELERGREQVRAAGVRSERYTPLFDRLGNAVAPDNLQGGFKFNQQWMTKESLESLALLAEMLPADDTADDDTANEIAKIRQALKEVEQQLLASNIPDSVRQFLLAELEIIRRALDDYEILGPRAFREAMGQIIVYEHSRPQSVESVEDEPAVQRQRTLLKRFWSIARAVGAIGGTTKGVQNLLEFAKNLLTSGN